MLVLSCDAIDVTDPNFNDQNIGVWEIGRGNNYTYIEITGSEVSFYYYDGVYRCSDINVTLFKIYKPMECIPSSHWTKVPVLNLSLWVFKE